MELLRVCNILKYFGCNLFALSLCNMYSKINIIFRYTNLVVVNSVLISFTLICKIKIFHN